MSDAEHLGDLTVGVVVDAVKRGVDFPAMVEVLLERNNIERAKLAEMRAARMLQAFNVSHNRRGDLLPTELEDAQDTADKLTAEVLGEDAPDTEVKS